MVDFVVVEWQLASELVDTQSLVDRGGVRVSVRKHADENRRREERVQRNMLESRPTYLDAIVIRIDWTTVGVNETSIIRALIQIVWHTVIVRVGGADTREYAASVGQALTTTIDFHSVAISNKDGLPISRHVQCNRDRFRVERALVLQRPLNVGTISGIKMIQLIIILSTANGQDVSVTGEAKGPTKLFIGIGTSDGVAKLGPAV